jgi:hypothetical protein
VGAERRKTCRYIVDRDYFYLPGDKKKHHRCSVKNISATGACIASARELNEHDILYLHITGPRISLVKSEVVWRRGSIYGILFHLETTEDLDSISYIMNNIAGSINSDG